MLQAEERYRLLEEVSELSARWDYAGVAERLSSVETDDLHAEPELGCSLAVAFYYLAQLEKAAALIQTLAEPCAARGKDRLHCRRLLLVGNLHVEHGELAKGIDAYLEVLKDSSAVQDKRMVAAATMNIATVAWLRCDYGAALASYERTLAAYGSLSETYRLAGCHHNLAMVYKEMGLLKESSQHFDISRTLYQEAGGPREIAFNDYERALLMHMRGDSAAANASAVRALTTLQALQLEREQADALRVLGVIHRDLGDYSQARDHLETALQFASGTTAKLLQAEVLEEMALLFQSEGDHAGADERAGRSMALYTQIGCETRAARVASRLQTAKGGFASLLRVR